MPFSQVNNEDAMSLCFTLMSILNIIGMSNWILYNNEQDETKTSGENFVLMPQTYSMKPKHVIFVCQKSKVPHFFH